MIKYNAYDVQVASKTDPAARYVLASDYAALEAERDDWMRRCQNLVEAMRHHGYSAESMARIAEGRDNG